MRKNIISMLGYMFCAGVLFLASCTKQDHFYKDYIVERIYTGKPDSIWIQPGDQRLVVGWLTPSDIEAKDMVIRYGTGDSVVVVIDRNMEKQSVVIEGLEERDYTVHAYTSNRSTTQSLLMELSTTVYGDRYRSTVQNMALSHTVVFPDSIGLVWNLVGQPDDLYGTEIEFTNKSGVKQTVFLHRSEINVLHDVDPNEPIIARGAYRPHPQAFEYFYTAPIMVDLEQTARNSFTFGGGGYTKAVYIDFQWLRTFEYDFLPRPLGNEIDLCYVLGAAATRGNFITMDADPSVFGAFNADWRDGISQWPFRREVNIKRSVGAGAVTLYDSLDETDRGQMIAAYENSTNAETKRLTLLAVDDIILLHSVERDLYVAMKVIKVADGVSDDFTVEFKVSRPE